MPCRITEITRDIIFSGLRSGFGYVCCVLVTQSCLTLCDSMDCSPPGFSVHGILWTRILKWETLSFSRDLPDSGIEPVSLALQAHSLPSELPGFGLVTTKPTFIFLEMATKMKK